MESITTNICVNVTVYYWKLCSVGLRVTAPSSPSRTLSAASYLEHTLPDTPTHSLALSVCKVGVIFHFFYPLCRSLQTEGVCSVRGFHAKGKRKGKRAVLCHRRTDNKPHGKGEQAPSGRQPEQRPSLSFTKKEEKSEAAIFSVNSFLEGSEPDAQGFISMELDHKWDQARCSVICHQIARMQCPNMERMSCPKHLFLAMAFPASRSKLQLIDKHRPRTPLRPTPHFP